MTMKAFLIAAAALGFVIGTGTAWSESSDSERDELAKALQGTKLTLEEGLKASEKSGKPISAKFEVEEGHLQFSAYTMAGDDFSEVVANAETGVVEKAEKITDAEDLEAARDQKQAMDKATVSLLSATEKAVKENGGYRAVSIVPVIKGSHPIADVALLKGSTFKTVSEKLD